MAGEQVWGVSVVGGCCITFMAGAQVWGVSVMRGRYSRYRTGGGGGGGGLIMLMAGEQVLGVSLLVGTTCGGSLRLAPTRGFAAVSVGVAHSHDTWQKPTRSAVRLAKHLLSALTKVK